MLQVSNFIQKLFIVYYIQQMQRAKLSALSDMANVANAQAKLAAQVILFLNHELNRLVLFLLCIVILLMTIC